jgi:hypothetical protein
MIIIMSETLEREHYIRAVSKKNEYLSVSKPTKLSKQLELDGSSYVSVYIDPINAQLVFKKIEV